MKVSKNPESFKTLTKKQWQEWNNTTFRLFWKLWIVILAVQVFLFIFFEPTADFSRSQYFYRYIWVPSGLEAISLIAVWLFFTKIHPTYNRRIVSAYTILLSTIFIGVTVCVHSGIKMLQALLLLPMMLTPLYKDKLMTALQALLVIVLYILSAFYFGPRALDLLLADFFTPYIELSVFIGATFSTYIILERVNAIIVLNEERSKHDSLTHLYNHENFYVELDYYCNRFKKEGLPFSIIIADIDNFKKVNDTYGHAFGDEVIRKVGELFKEHGTKEAFCARYGGEEFAMILPHDKPVAVAEQIRKAFELSPFESPNGEKYFTLSLGAAIYTDNYPNANEFFEAADSALYYAKKHGKNRVILSGSPQMKDN